MSYFAPFLNYRVALGKLWLSTASASI